MMGNIMKPAIIDIAVTLSVLLTPASILCLAAARYKTKDEKSVTVITNPSPNEARRPGLAKIFVLD